jgi:hypothetical protein
MFRVTVNWEQTLYYEVTMVTNAPPNTEEWWDEVMQEDMYNEADVIDCGGMDNITFTDEEIV